MGGCKHSTWAADTCMMASCPHPPLLHLHTRLHFLSPPPTPTPPSPYHTLLPTTIPPTPPSTPSSPPPHPPPPHHQPHPLPRRPPLLSSPSPPPTPHPLPTQCCECLCSHPPAAGVIIKLHPQPSPHQQPASSTQTVLSDPLDGSSSSSSTDRTWRGRGEERGQGGATGA